MSNWEKLRKEINASTKDRKAKYEHSKKRKRGDEGKAKGNNNSAVTRRKKLLTWAEEHDIPAVDLKKAYADEMKDAVVVGTPNDKIGRYVALDCEFVGVGMHESALARVSIVNYHGRVLLDAIVKPKERVTDWRTPISGIRPTMMKDARPFDEVQREVADLVRGRILVGHALWHDLKALLLSHPRRHTRDTSTHPPFRALSMANLQAQDILAIDFQAGQHSSVEDARVTMQLYKEHKGEFEARVYSKLK